MEPLKTNTKQDYHKSTNKNKLIKFLDGSILTKSTVVKELPFFALLSVLSLFYIWNSYDAEMLSREIRKLEKDLKQLRAESISITSELMHSSNQSEVYKLLKEKGSELEESKIPPTKIEIIKN